MFQTNSDKAQSEAHLLQGMLPKQMRQNNTDGQTDIRTLHLVHICMRKRAQVTSRLNLFTYVHLKKYSKVRVHIFSNIMWLCTYIYIYVYLCNLVYIHTYIGLKLFVYVHTHKFTYCTYIRSCLFMYMCCIHTCKQKFTNANKLHIYIYIYIYVCACIYL